MLTRPMILRIEGLLLDLQYIWDLISFLGGLASSMSLTNQALKLAEYCSLAQSSAEIRWMPALLKELSINIKFGRVEH